MNYELIKVCGMRDADNIRAVEALGVDWLGLIFWPKSSRYVSEKPAYLPTRCKRVGVFVDADPADILRHVADYRLDIIQLHGHESPEYVRSLRAACHVSRGISAAPAIIKAISVSTRADIAAYKQYDGLVDYFLFDTRATAASSATVPAGSSAGPILPGGTGLHFDWSVLDAYDGQTPFLLSGGIGPGDADRVLAFHHPKCVGIDLNSRFETAPGLKDISKLREFIKKIRS